MNRKTATELFFDAMDDTAPECALDGGRVWDSLTWKQQVRMCKRCPLLDPCRTYADSLGATINGIWAGRSYPRTPEERAKEQTPCPSDP